MCVPGLERMWSRTVEGLGGWVVVWNNWKGIIVVKVLRKCHLNEDVHVGVFVI